MHYEGDIFRPPNEAESIVLQVTTGCSHNRCSFCAMYKKKLFHIKDDSVIWQDLEYASRHFPTRTRLFLCDGDALIIPQERLLGIFDAIHRYLPQVRRIASYANAKSVARKTPEELRTLREQGLAMLHLGLESGDDDTLGAMNKWGTSDEIVAQGIKVNDAKIRLFVTVLLGCAGTERSAIHAQKTGEALTRMNPSHVGVLSLMPVEGTPLHDAMTKGTFVLPDSRQMLEELRVMLEHTDLRPGVFYANHASNYLPLRIRMPRDKADALAYIDRALDGKIPVMPEWLRGL